MLFCEEGEGTDSQRKMGPGYNKDTEQKKTTIITLAPENEPSNCRLARLSSFLGKIKESLYWIQSRKK